MREMVLRGTPTHILRALLSTTRVGTLKKNSQAYGFRASALAGARPGGAKHITPVLLLFSCRHCGRVRNRRARHPYRPRRASSNGLVTLAE